MLVYSEKEAVRLRPEDDIGMVPAVSVASPFTVFFRDRFMPASEACVPVTDPGYLLGEGVFATLRGYDGVCFRPERHLAGLARGAAMFGMTLPLGIERIAEVADEAAVRCGAKTAYVRVTVTRGGDDKGVLSVLAREFDVPSAADYEDGVAVTVVTRRRVPPECMDGSMKSTSYAPSVLARREVTLRGARDGLQLAVDGSLACGTMGNVFLVTDETLLTPPLSTGCRAGVTREAILEIATESSLETRVERIDPAALYTADEVFLTSTRVECLPIASIDGRPLRGASPRTALLRERLRALVERETKLRRC